MIKKVFILSQFGSPHPWTDEYLKNIGNLEKYGYYWKIFTPNNYENVPSNVEVVNMDIEGLNELMEKKLGVNPHNFILPNGTPSKAVSDFYVASGVIFEDYIKDFDFWGMANWDIVYGRLPLFIPDEVFEHCEIFSDDVFAINGIFSLFKNNEKINNLFRKIPDWENKFKTHQLYGMDEYDLTDVVKKNNSDLMFMFPMFYPIHSHDRLKQHQPDVKLEMKEDGSLWELFEDIGHPNWEHARPYIGREIAYFHFIRTKRWPDLSKK